LHEVDGEVVIRLVPKDHLRDQPPFCAFAGELLLPTGQLCIYTTGPDPLASITVSNSLAAVEIWTNDESNPDEVVVVVG